MYSCGLRSEATTLEVSAIERASLVLRIVGKGSKERLAPLPQPVLDELGRHAAPTCCCRFGAGLQRRVWIGLRQYIRDNIQYGPAITPGRLILPHSGRSRPQGRRRLYPHSVS
jgi:hypothetical protein